MRKWVKIEDGIVTAVWVLHFRDNPGAGWINVTSRTENIDVGWTYDDETDTFTVPATTEDTTETLRQELKDLDASTATTEDLMKGIQVLLG